MYKLSIPRLIFAYDLGDGTRRAIGLRPSRFRVQGGSIMRRRFHHALAGASATLVPVALSFATLAASAFSARAAQDPVVIPGVSPAQMAAAARVDQAAQPRPGSFGGGLIDYLLTGYTGGVADDNSRRARAGGAPATRTAFLNPVAPTVTEPREAPDSEFRRQEVAYDGPERPGTIVIDTPHKFLFLVEPAGRALRYGIGVGRPGFEWSGVKTISRKAEWPGWTPPPEMLLRRPELPDHLDGGPGNPLGARALYLGSSMYRIHGTNEPETIGKNVSSGCIRMMNQDVIDLYDRVPVGTKVIVI
jgi:lipoprotein-anchoring transpeptidase ErfK/SrfK